MVRASLLLFFLLLSQGINAQVMLAGKTFPEQCRLYDSLVYTFWDDSSITITEHFQPYIAQAIDNDDEELELMLNIRLLWEAYDSREINKAKYQAQHEMLVTKIKKMKLDHMLALAYKDHAFYLRKTGWPAESIKYNLMAYELYSKMDPSFFIYKKIYIMGLGSAYYAFKDYAKALRYLHEAAAVPTAFEPSLYNTIGLTYFRLKNDDSAMYYFDSAYRYSIKAGREDWQIILTGNLVKPLVRSKQYDSAIVVAQKALRLSENYWEKVVKCRILAELGGIYLLKNELDKAEMYYTRAIKCHYENDTIWQYNELPSAVTIFENFAEIKKRQSNYKDAYGFLDSAKSLKDSLNHRNSLERVKNIEFELAQNKLNNTNKELLFEQTETKLQRNLLIAIIAASTLFILFLISWYSKRKDKLEAEKNKATYELKASRDKLENFTNSIHEKNKLLEKLEKKLTTYESQEQAIEYTTTISELQEATILTDDDWSDFRKTFEKAHPGYLLRLKETYAMLTPSEIRYILLSKLDMNTKEMASILGVSAGSVRTTKSRLMRKIGLENEEDLKNMINSL